MTVPEGPTGFDDRDDNPYSFPRRRFVSTPVVVALILSAAALAAIFLAVGRYTPFRPAQGVFIYEIDRFTGDARLCNATGCRDLPNNPKPVDEWGKGVPVQ
jgi:hypothetical protein